MEADRLELDGAGRAALVEGGAAAVVRGAVLLRDVLVGMTLAAVVSEASGRSGSGCAVGTAGR